MPLVLVGVAALFAIGGASPELFGLTTVDSITGPPDATGEVSWATADMPIGGSGDRRYTISGSSLLSSASRCSLHRTFAVGLLLMSMRRNSVLFSCLYGAPEPPERFAGIMVVICPVEHLFGAGD